MTHRSRISDHGSTAIRPGRISIPVRDNEILHLIKLIQSIPDIREEKVALIQREVENNTYSAIAEQIVDKIISGTLVDRV